MKKIFFLAGLLSTVVNLLLNAGAYFFILKEVFEKHPPVSAEFQKKLVRPDDQLIGWALALSALTMGFFIAFVIKWSGARTFVSGLKKGFIVALLFWSSINFGLYSSSNHFSQVGVFADLACSVTAMTIAAAAAAWILGKGKTI